MAIERPAMSNPIEEQEQLMNRAENFTESDIAMDPTILDDVDLDTSDSEDAQTLVDDNEEEFRHTGSVDPLSQGQE